MLQKSSKRRPSLLSKLSSRRSTLTPLPTEDDEDLHLPLELILHIFDLSSSSCTDFAAQEHLHQRFRSVNRTLSLLFSRRRFQSMTLEGGEELPELLQMLKKKPDVADGLEGIELRNLIPHDSRKRLEKDWEKLRRAAPGLTYIQLGDLEVRIKQGTGVPSYVLHAMEGVSVLRLANLELISEPPPRTLLNWTPTSTPLLPPNLRHLTMDGIEIRGEPNKLPPSIWPEPSQCQLTSIFLSDVRHFSSPSSGGTETLLRHAAPSLRALHYSLRQQDQNSSSEPLPSILEDIDFPSLRILSVSLLHFTPSLTSTALNLTHLFLTMCDVSAGHRSFPARTRSSVVAYRSLINAFSPPALPSSPDVEMSRFYPVYVVPTWAALEVLELPARKRVGFMEQETTGFRQAEQARAEALEAARARGINATTVYFLEDETVEERFRRAVREVLKEKV